MSERSEPAGAEPTAWPTVTVIVLNYNGLAHLQHCFTSLGELDYPADRLELMMVDNASTDGSVDYVRSAHPGVRVVQSNENVGFAAGNNLGARQAVGDHVVFLNNDMAVDRGLVKGMVETLAGDPEAVSAGAKILNWDGTRFDFTGAICNFAGRAAQVGFDEPYRDDRYDRVVPMLFACGGAMIIDRQLFLDVGGFDEDYFIYFEDVDLGWRLWLLGHKVLFAPTAVTYHRHHGTMERFPSYRKALLYERNALCTVIKNYGDENLGRVLPAVLLATAAGVVEEAVNSGQLDRESFAIKSGKKMDRKPVSLDKRNVSALVAVQEVATALPRWMEKRRVVQDRRRRSDEEIAHLFRPYFPHSPWRWPSTVYSVTRALGVQELFESAPRRVLVVSPDLLPYEGVPTVGAGLRAWGLGQGLRARGHDVLFSMPAKAIVGYEDRLPEEAGRLAWRQRSLEKLLRTVEPDVLVAGGWPVLTNLLESPRIPVVLDQHGPHMLEREYQGTGYGEGNAAEKIRALRMADYFTCAGQRQLDYFQDWLARAGWSEEDRRERAVGIPVSLSPELPARQPGDELTFVFGGTFLPWQDPSIGLETLAHELEQRDQGRLLLFGGRHRFHPIEGGVMDELVERLGRSPRVVVAGTVTHEELVDTYSRSHVAIDLMKSNSERQLAFTTRTAEYLWCGLPVIYNDYAELADHIREYEAGWTVDPEDAEAIAKVISGIFDDPTQVEERSRNAQRLARERLNWERSIAPVDRFVRRPSMRRAGTPGALMPPEVELLVQRLRARLSPAADRRVRRLLGALAGRTGSEASGDDAVVPLEVALFVNRASRLVPLPLARAARNALRRISQRKEEV